MPKLSYTGRDYQSILQELIEISPQLSTAYDPQSENDPASFLLKCMALDGDMLSFYIDKMALETTPATMTQRKVADAYYRMMGYYMDWFRPAVSKVTIGVKLGSNGKPLLSTPVILPKYTRLRSISGDTVVTLIEDTVIKVPQLNSDTNKYENQEIEVYEGIPILKTFDTSSRLLIVDNAYELGSAAKRIMIDSVTVVDKTGSKWTQVQDINKQPQLGKFFDVYADEADRLYVRFSPYINQTSVEIAYIEYLSSQGEGTSILEDSLNGGQILAYVVDYATGRENKLIITGADGKDYSSDEIFSIVDTKASPEPTRGPETAQEAFIAAQKYISTTDTLVTPLDYENAIKRISGISNCIVTDSFTEDMFNIRDDVVAGSTNSDGKLSASTTYRARYIYENYNPARSETDIASTIENYIRGLNAVNLKCIASQNYFILTWNPVGTITLSESVSTDEADELLEKICYNLAHDYHPKNISFGNGVTLVELVDKIKSYDRRIMAVDLKPITYVITKIKNIGTEGAKEVFPFDDLIQIYKDYIGGDTTGMSPEILDSARSSALESHNYSLRHWHLYNAYSKNNSGEMVGNSLSGLAVNKDMFPNGDSYYEENKGVADFYSTLQSSSNDVYFDDSGYDSNGDRYLILEPSDFFQENHPFRRISIARFSGYKYYDGDTAMKRSILLNFKKSLTINKESLR